MIEAGSQVQHLTSPGEPFAQDDAFGEVVRVTPSGGVGVPAQAYVSWGEGDYLTWELIKNLKEL